MESGSVDYTTFVAESESADDTTSFTESLSGTADDQMAFTSSDAEVELLSVTETSAIAKEDGCRPQSVIGSIIYQNFVFVDGRWRGDKKGVSDLGNIELSPHPDSIIEFSLVFFLCMASLGMSIGYP